MLSGYLETARELAARRDRPVEDGTLSGLDPDAESLRWFDLPAVCLT
jgi:hypothetical protein